MPVSVFVEVSDTLGATFITGFQRHTREFLRRLPTETNGLANADTAFTIVPIRWCIGCGAFRRLDDAEHELLRAPGSPQTVSPRALSRLADRLPGPFPELLRRAVHLPSVRRTRHRIERFTGRRTHPLHHAALRIDDWPAGSWFLDLEAVWHNPATRDRLLPELRSHGVRTAALIADVMPELYPQWFSRVTVDVFHRFIRAHLAHSDQFVCISECTLSDTRTLARRLGRTRPLDAIVIPLGADFADIGRVADVELPDALTDRPFILCVGTLEPRKNQSLVIDAIERLNEHPELAVVLVGRVGWKVDELVARIEGHPLLGDRLFWFDQADDALLQTLYRHAFLAVVPSRYEGYGLPVIEALAHGTPTISSHRGALAEAGGDRVEQIDPDDVDALAALLSRHLTDPVHHQERRNALAGYRAPTWDEAATALAAALETFIA